LNGKNMDMARLVLGLRMLLARNQNAQSPYPVLGAIGGDFFLEISSGTLRDRRILTTIYVTMGREFALASLQPDGWHEEGIRDEIHIGLPDASHVIALAGLMEKSLGAGSFILHPLTCRGDFLDGWDDAVAIVTV